MNNLQLVRWRDSFNKEIQHLQTEYDAFFQSKPLSDFYELVEDEGEQNLHLEILHEEELPKEISSRLIKILEQTKPEDSI